MRGDGAIVQHPKSRFLWIRYSRKGKLYRESTGTVDPKQAAKKLKDKVAEIRLDKAGKVVFVPNTQLRVRNLLDALEAYYRINQVKGLAQIKFHLKLVREILGGYRAQDLTPDIVDWYIETRLTGNAKAKVKAKARGTINRETTLLGRAFRLAVKRNKLKSIPLIQRLSEEGTARQGFFESSEFQAVLSHLSGYLKGFTQFGYLSGWRKKEIRTREWSDVDMLGKVIRLKPGNSKNDRGRVLVLTGGLWGVIERQWKMREYKNADGTVSISAYVFHKNGAPIGDTRKAWATACKKAGIKKLFHDLRRTRARDMRRAGAPEDVCMKVLRHRTRSIFTRYDIIDEKDQQEALLKAEEYLEAEQQQQQQQQQVIPVQKEVAGIN